jgi:hypothetical protein
MLKKVQNNMNSNTPNERGSGYEMHPGEAAEIRRLFEEVQKHVAQVQRRQISKRIRYGKAAKKATREQN